VAQNGEGAGVAGYPIFDGLTVPPNGINFSCRITNVANTNDENLLSFLTNDTFTKGLQMISGFNPALPAITDYAQGIAKIFLSRHENVLIHSFDLGLNLTKISTRPKLREGSYIVAQAPANAIKWNLWVWDPGLGRVRWYHDNGILQYNYVIFSVSRGR
jgi:hypothetical protein